MISGLSVKFPNSTHLQINVYLNSRAKYLIKFNVGSSNIVPASRSAEWFKASLSAWEVWDSIFGLVDLTQCC